MCTLNGRTVHTCVQCVALSLVVSCPLRTNFLCNPVHDIVIKFPHSTGSKFRILEGVEHPVTYQSITSHIVTIEDFTINTEALQQLSTVHLLHLV